MHIGFESSSATIDNPTGVSRYIVELVGELQKIKNPDDRFSFFYKWSRWRQRARWWRPSNVDIRLYQQPWWPLKTSVDIIHGLDGVVPNFRKARKIVTIHDLLVMVNESDVVARPKFREKKRRVYMEMVRRADAVITVSRSTKNDVAELLNFPREHIHAIHLGTQSCFGPLEPAVVQPVLKRYQLEPGYLLFVGAISGRKNTARLVRAFANSSACKNRVLVLAGKPSYHGDATFTAVREPGLAKNVRFLGFVADNDLPALYNGAAAFLFPTLYEGFGMPVLEAMACGTAVLTSNIGASPEISNGHACLVDPYDIDSITAGIEAVLNTPDKAIAAARQYARTFTWRQCAKQTWDVYQNYN